MSEPVADLWDVDVPCLYDPAPGEQCDASVPVMVEIPVYRPATYLSPAEGGAAETTYDFPYLCIGCGHRWNEKERREIEERAWEQVLIERDKE